MRGSLRGGGGGRGRHGQGHSFAPPPPTPVSILQRENHISLETMEAAVVKAKNDLLAAGESVSTWKVSQHAALALQASSWDSLSFRFNDVPSLRNLQFVEGKVNAFIHCFVSTRRMTSVHELGIELCKNEGVEQFDDLALGPLLRHPLVQHYFSVPPDAIEVCKITVEELIARLTVFQYKKKYKQFTVEVFLDFLVQKYSVAAKENLGVRIQSMGMYIKFIRKNKMTEDVALKSIQERGLQREELVDDDANNINTSGILESDDDGTAAQCSLKKQQTCGQNSAKRLTLTDDKLEAFMVTWKGACQTHSVDEVLAMMLLHNCKTSEKKKRKMERLYLSYPGVGLLNIAVRFMKFGELNSLTQDLNENVLLNPISTSTGIINEEQSSGGDQASVAEKCITTVKNNVSADDIIKQVNSYFGSGHLMSKRDLSVEEQTAVSDCEIWLNKKFSVSDFRNLGHGSFSEFIGTHTSLLPRELQYFLTGDFCGIPSVNVSMLQEQFLIFLSQAARSAGDCVISGEYISVLLKKQFPAISLQLTRVEPEESFSDLIKNKVELHTPRSLTFSTTLVGNFLGKSHLLREEAEGPSSMPFKSVGALGSVSINDAIECLLRAPMLSDLQLWSHWDLLYAPSHGPILEFLLRLGCAKDLSCIVTSDGRIVRIDHSASLDEFFEASVFGSSFYAATKLLSLFFVYGGSQNLPVALLKCYCQRAFDLNIKNFMELKSNGNSNKFLQKSSSQGCKKSQANDGCTIMYEEQCACIELPVNTKLHEDLPQVDKAHAIVATFIVECLGHLPPEFRGPAADILFSSLKFFSRDASLLMLSACTSTDERIMLHEIGLSLGIMEWVKDYQAFSSLPTDGICSSSVTLNRQSKHAFSSPMAAVSFPSSGTLSGQNSGNMPSMLSLFPADCGISVNTDSKLLDHYQILDNAEVLTNQFDHNVGSVTSANKKTEDAARLVEKIRYEEFGLDSNLDNADRCLLKKQHARLGRALHCLSQELYSHDSHFILELVQNADDNRYPENIVPTLAFILHATSIVVMNNEQGFSEQNIRALCDVGSSTKKGSCSGYIGKKGIGFKSVFRVSDAPEIHSNGFHVKFDIKDGPIGFVLPTNLSPCNIELYRKQVPCDYDHSDDPCWNTCIVLPFNSKIKQSTGLSHIVSMFSDLHPSILLFLQRLCCIKFKNMLDDKLVTMRKVILKDGIVRVSHGDDSMCWLVVDKSLQSSVIRPDVQMTKIAVAFTLKDSDNEDYIPVLDQQPVFAFLPLRTYGLKFILHGDFVLPSSREEVDGDSAWNQWLLSEFPDLFVTAESSFCMLPCFQDRPGKAVTVFMSFVPIIGEVHGFFSLLPHMILSRLRLSNCLLLDDSVDKWVQPCRALRNWNEQIREFIPESLLQQHLGLGYLSRDIVLSDPLAKALGIQEYNPKLLVDLLSSICHFGDGIRVLGLDWLSSWLSALYTFCGSLSDAGLQEDVLNCLRHIPFIPLSDGSYGSLAKGPIWLPFDILGRRSEAENSLKLFPVLCSKLRTVDPLLFSIDGLEETRVDRMLCKIGVQQLSSHEVIRNHILLSISAEKIASNDHDMMIEYLSFIMIHFQSACPKCNKERDKIILELLKMPVILTNHGYKSPSEEAIHFSKDFGSSIDVKKLIDNTDIKWNEVHTIYLKHLSTLSFANGLSNWREFFHELGVTDFVQVVRVERNVADVLNNGSKSISCGDVLASELHVWDWESPELLQLLSALSSNKSLEKSTYFMEILDKMWDAYYSPKAKCYIPVRSNEEPIPYESSFLKTIHKFKWVASSIDNDVHYPKDLFYDCKSVRSILGVLGPYAIPKVHSKRFLEDIQFKVHVTLDDALRAIRYRRYLEVSASISQMTKFYTFIRDELSLSNEKLSEVRSSISIFIPQVPTSGRKDKFPGIFMPPDKLCWHDPTGCLDQLKENFDGSCTTNETESFPCTTLANLYPDLHDFLVSDCGVPETLTVCSYLKLLLKLSRNNSPSDAAHQVFQVFLKWADDLKSGSLNSRELDILKECLFKLENTVLPSVQGKWISLHPSFGLVCWSDDDNLIEQCMHLNDVYFLQFGELTVLEKEMLSGKVGALMQKIGIRALFDVVSREPIFYGISDCTKVASLIHWVIPYTQRYLYKFHSDVYFDFKHCGLEKLVQLQVIAVENLYYRYALYGHFTTNSRRYECSCLLQGSILYTTPTTDTHSIYLELSRCFFNGSPELQMANFLHMISNMAELGSTVEHIESFIADTQKMHMLPAEEPIWTCSNLLTVNSGDNLSRTDSCPMSNPKQKYPNSAKKQLNRTNWPPTNWKTAPDFHSPSELHLNESTTCETTDEIHSTVTCEAPETFAHQEWQPVWTKGDDEFFVKADCTTMEVQIPLGTKVELDSDQTNSSTFTERDNLCFGAPEENGSYKTGRAGELIAYKYFTERFGSAAEVRWVNEEAESGLPYDLIIGKGRNREYIEVKSTASASKDWFPISTNEFHYASGKGESYSIARVVLSSRSDAEISVFKNPVKLCKENVLKLALLVPHDSL